MAKTKDGLTAEIDAAITANGAGQITGPVMNTILKSMVGSLSGGYYTFPADNTLSTADIGKLVMNDGSGTAKVYQLSSATTEQKGRFILKLTDLNDLNDQSSINVNSLSNGQYFSRVDWRNGNTPTTPLEELQLIMDYIDANTNLSNLATSIVNDELVIEENTYDFTYIKLSQFPFLALEVDTLSRPALPAAPTAFPLGKLLGIENGNALISSSSTETYSFEGTAILENTFYNNETDIDFADMTALTSFSKFLVVPAADGKAKIIDLNDFDFDESFRVSLRHHFLGIAIGATSNSITVVQINHLSLIAQFILRLVNKVILIDKNK